MDFWRMAMISTAMAGVLISQSASAQRPMQAVATSITAEDVRLVVSAAKREMNARYVFEDVAQQAGAALDTAMASGAYAAISDPIKLAAQLTTDVQRVTRDKHIRVRYSATPIPERTDTQQQSAEEIAAEKASEARGNFGVERVERLPGNLGYIDLRGFATIEWAGETISAAMTLIANTDALIVDLRKNGGGDPQTVSWMMSYLLDERTHLNSFFHREANRTSQFWSNEFVPGKKFGGKKPIYVLTSKQTFSGAEEFSYNVKALKRGTLVGERTGGGANPGGSVRLTAHFSMFIPSGRAINPITKTNWEGVGVEPDVNVPAEDALRSAQILALKKLLGDETKAPSADRIRSRIAELEREPSKQ